jgi:hypothetical protein
MLGQAELGFAGTQPGAKFPNQSRFADLWEVFLPECLFVACKNPLDSLAVPPRIFQAGQGMNAAAANLSINSLVKKEQEPAIHRESSRRGNNERPTGHAINFQEERS